MEIKIIAQAKKNFRDYKIIERWVAGLELKGSEIKSIRNRQATIDEAYVLPRQKELYVIKLHIATYKHASNFIKIDSCRERKLLLTRREINKIIGVMKAKNYILIPLRLLFVDEKKRWVKLEIALAQHLRKYQIKEKIRGKKLKRKIKRSFYSQLRKHLTLSHFGFPQN